MRMRGAETIFLGVQCLRRSLACVSALDLGTCTTKASHCMLDCETQIPCAAPAWKISSKILSKFSKHIALRKATQAMSHLLQQARDWSFLAKLMLQAQLKKKPFKVSKDTIPGTSTTSLVKIPWAG